MKAVNPECSRIAVRPGGEDRGQEDAIRPRPARSGKLLAAVGRRQAKQSFGSAEARGIAIDSIDLPFPGKSRVASQNDHVAPRPASQRQVLEASSAGYRVQVVMPEHEARAMGEHGQRLLQSGIIPRV